jgi:hypothetical protein
MPLRRPHVRRRLTVVVALIALGLAGAVAASAAEPGQDDPGVVTAPETTAAPAPAEVEPTPPVATEPETTSEPAPAEPAPAEPAPDTDQPDTGLLVHPAPSVYAAAAGPDAPAPAQAQAPRRHTAARPAQRTTQPASLPSPAASAGVVWLNAPLPDPTPPSLRLRAAFAHRLHATARRQGVDWALVLAVLRARGRLGAVPAGPLGLRGVETLLARGRAPKVDPRAALRGWTPSESAIEAAQARRQADRTLLGRISDDAAFVERATALALYYRAVGLRALHTGLEAGKPRLAGRLLGDPRIQIYPGGRGDLEAERIDVRVLAVIAYLAATYGQVTVTSLESGHRLYARPGVVSAHVYGRAVDVAAVAGVSIEGHQQPDGITADAVRAILLLPEELQPKQVISLLGLGGPSFALANHYDHIHVGY